MTGQVALGKLGQGGVPVKWRRLTQPVTRQHEGVLSAHYWSADYPFTETGQVQHMDERLASGGHAGRGETLPQLVTGQGAFAAERASNGPHTQLGRSRRNALLGEPAGVGGGMRRRRQGMQPEIIL